MSILLKRLAVCTALAACLLAGCATWKIPFLSGKRLPQSEVSPADRAVIARGVDQAGRSVWVRTVADPQADSPPPQYGWRYANLEELIARPAESRPDFRGLLADDDQVAAANAAIALARLGDDHGIEQLEAAIRAPEFKLSMRRAAIEALAGLSTPAAVSVLDRLIYQYGNHQGMGTYVADLHVELIRGLARHIDPAVDPRFVAALRSRSADVRMEALRAWSRGHCARLPVEAVDLCSDSDPRVRGAALQAMARCGHDDAGKHLSAAVHDLDLQVRTAAIDALGRLGGAEACGALEPLLENEPEKVRAEAVNALARLDAKQAVLSAAGDKSWRVRLQVARALAAWSDREAVAAAGELIGDPSMRVRAELVRRLADWPLEKAGPLLLAAMGRTSYATRRSAAEQLAERWPPAAEFPIEGSAERRRDVLASLQRRFGQQFGVVDRDVLKRALGARPAARISPKQLGRVEELVRRRDVAALANFGPELVEALEQLAVDRHQVLPEAVYRDVLPKRGPAFAALNRLASSEVVERRRAAGELIDLARQRPLRRLAVSRLNLLVAAEPDQLVWRSVLTAIAGDGSEAAVRLAGAGLSHPAAEVRRRACEHLAAHPSERTAKLLMPALEDDSLSVVCAAVRALAAAGRIDDTEPLHRLLGRGNEYVRIETAVALRRLGDAAGTDELKRLSYSSDPEIRRRVASSLGERPEPEFMPALIRMLDDRRASVRSAALASLPKVAGQRAADTVESESATTTERIRRWKQWYQRRG